jgi:N-acetylneuraminate synthase
VPSLQESVLQYQLTTDHHREIARYCRAHEVVFFSSCFSFAEVDLLESLEVPAYKIASMDVNNLPLLQYVAGTRKPVLLSTGMATLGEVERALQLLRDGGTRELALLHCVSLYPSPPETVHLRMLETWRRAFGVPVGYSDHSLGVAVPLAAIALGACVIEKHFTVDQNLEGWDHAISADPLQFGALVEGSRAVFSALGSGVRRVSEAELEKRKVFRRRMVTTRPLKCGEFITAEDVTFKRPGTGIQPDELRYVVGRAVARDVEAEEELEWADLR